MGRVRVAGLDFSIDYLRSEIAAFQNLMNRDGWMIQGNLKNRRATVRGLTFIMLNLRCDDENEAWRLFHLALDTYYDMCDRLRVTY